MRVFKKSLSSALWMDWMKHRPRRIPHNESKEAFFKRMCMPHLLRREAAFACIIMFESGLYDVDPKTLTNVMAVSSGDSIFAAAPLICDPFDEPAHQEVR